MDSILQRGRECYVCGTSYNLHTHHIFEGSYRRKASENNGFKVYLCARHHNMSNEGVHFNKDLELMLKRDCQRKYEETHTRDEFIKLIGRNYLDD